MKKFTTMEAIAYAESGAWKELTHRERAELQMFQVKSCMPFDVFHESIEAALGRPVFTHEMAGKENWDKLHAELKGEHEAPSIAEVVDKLPKDKPGVVVITP